MNDKKIKIFAFSWKDTLLSLILLMIPFGLCCLIQIYIEDSAIYSSLLFLFSVFLISRFTNGYLYGTVSSIIASFIVNYAFTIPYFELSFSIPAYILTFFVMLAIALLTSVMTTRLMEEESIKIEAEKERMRGNFLQSVSHDLRTPLTSILGNSTNLAKNENISENDMKAIIAIKEEAENLLGMVENVLSISKINTNLKLSMHEELVEELFEEAIHRFKNRYIDAKVLAQVPDKILFVNVDSKLFGQILNNLLENAYIHGKSDLPIILYAEYDKSFVYIKIKDFGPGITDDVDRYLNQSLFVSDDYDYLYKGIGLSVSNTIAKLHGEIIQASNNPDVGATFTIKIPVVKNVEK